MSAAGCCSPPRALAGLLVWHLKKTGARQVPCQFVQLCHVANDRLITFQYFNFLKRMYVTQHNKDLSQRAKPKSDPLASPFRELQQPDQEKKIIHKIRPISPVYQPLSETPSRNELREMKSTAEVEGSVTGVGAEPKEDRQWKEMKLRMDDLPGILARLSKIKLTALVVSTASAGFAMAPVPFDLTCFLLASLGTGLASCAANAINQVPGSVQGRASASSGLALLSSTFLTPRKVPVGLWIRSREMSAKDKYRISPGRVSVVMGNS